jgi:hypothetical protein
MESRVSFFSLQAALLRLATNRVRASIFLFANGSLPKIPEMTTSFACENHRPSLLFFLNFVPVCLINR